jgi:hypothetical protein
MVLGSDPGLIWVRGRAGYATHIVYPFGPKGDPDEGRDYTRTLARRCLHTFGLHILGFVQKLWVASPKGSGSRFPCHLPCLKLHSRNTHFPCCVCVLLVWGEGWFLCVFPLVFKKVGGWAILL